MVESVVKNGTHNIDHLCGGVGNDNLRGYAGNDTLVAGVEAVQVSKAVAIEAKAMIEPYVVKKFDKSVDATDHSGKISLKEHPIQSAVFLEFHHQSHIIKSISPEGKITIKEDVSGFKFMLMGLTLTNVNEVEVSSDTAKDLIKALGMDLDAPTLGNPPLLFWSVNSGRASNAMFYSSGAQSDITKTSGPNGGKAALFTGKEFGYIQNHESYQVKNATVTALFRADDLGGTQTILAKDQIGTGDGGHFHISVVDSGQIQVRLAEGAGSGENYAWKTKANVVKEGEWLHIAVTFGAEGASIHVDGRKLGNNAFTQVDGSKATSLSSYTAANALGNDKPFIIGANTRRSHDTSSGNKLAKNGDLMHHFKGAIANVGFWGGDTPQDTLRGSQIAKLANHKDGLDSILRDPSSDDIAYVSTTFIERDTFKHWNS
ncbi:MAG: LamG-like jellyroll fold domain-containing protein [Pseudomonadota bacterium]